MKTNQTQYSNYISVVDSKACDKLWKKCDRIAKKRAEAARKKMDKLINEIWNEKT